MQGLLPARDDSLLATTRALPSDLRRDVTALDEEPPRAGAVPGAPATRKGGGPDPDLSGRGGGTHDTAEIASKQLGRPRRLRVVIDTLEVAQVGHVHAEDDSELALADPRPRDPLRRRGQISNLHTNA